MLRQWDAQTIASEILRRYNSKKPLYYTGVANDNLSLLRAATRYFGTWEAAITFAGLDYSEIRRYKVWTRMRIITRIREHHKKGEDLSWRHVSLTLDPQLAGAATKKNHFGSWSEALKAAGLDYDLISRYKRWSNARILAKVREFHLSGRQMNAKKMEADEITLLTAARRRFGSWPQALQAAGLQPGEIVLRASFKGHNLFQPPTSHGKRSPSNVAAPTTAPDEKKNGSSKKQKPYASVVTPQSLDKSNGSWRTAKPANRVLEPARATAKTTKPSKTATPIPARKSASKSAAQKAIEPKATRVSKIATVATKPAAPKPKKAELAQTVPAKANAPKKAASPAKTTKSAPTKDTAVKTSTTKKVETTKVAAKNAKVKNAAQKQVIVPASQPQKAVKSRVATSTATKAKTPTPKVTESKTTNAKPPTTATKVTPHSKKSR